MQKYCHIKVLSELISTIYNFQEPTRKSSKKSKKVTVSTALRSTPKKLNESSTNIRATRKTEVVKSCAFRFRTTPRKSEYPPDVVVRTAKNSILTEKVVPQTRPRNPRFRLVPILGTLPATISVVSLRLGSVMGTTIVWTTRTKIRIVPRRLVVQRTFSARRAVAFRDRSVVTGTMIVAMDLVRFLTFFGGF